jgi:hypothetical protein
VAVAVTSLGDSRGKPRNVFRSAGIVSVTDNKFIEAQVDYAAYTACGVSIDVQIETHGHNLEISNFNLNDVREKRAERTNRKCEEELKSVFNRYLS